jgi:hypothetical protein
VFLYNQILRKFSGLALGPHPLAPLIIRRITEKVPEDLISGPPEGLEIEPGERPPTGGRHDVSELANILARPTGPRQ